MKIFCFSLVLIMFPLLGFSQKKNAGFEMSIDLPNLKNQKVFLGRYVMGKPYANDSIFLDNKGKGTLKKEKLLPEGLFMLYFSDGRYIDFIVSNNQQISIKGDTLNLPKNIQFGGSQETKDFFEYMYFLSEIQQTFAKLNEQYSNETNTQKKELLEQEMTALGQNLTKKQNQLIDKYAEGMVGVFLRGLRIPEEPDFSAENDSLRQLKRYLFYKNHYLDNIDFADPRVYNTPYLPSTLETYLNRVLVQHPDSIVPSVIALVERSKINPATFQILTSYMLNYGVKSKIMGMDKLMVELGNRYYLTGKATWADSTLIENLRKEIKKVETSLVGMFAANMYLADNNGVYTDLYSLCGEQLTVLYFFEPDCGHCKKTTPLLRDFYHKYKDDKRINVVAVYMLLNQEEWQSFIEKYELQDFHNRWDPRRVSRFWESFDTSTTPMMYVLDKDKKILAKKIDVETLEMIVKFELK